MAGPIILSNISVPLLGAVDTAVVGHLPAPYYIGAVGIGAMRADVMMVAMLLSFAVYMGAMFLMLPVLDNHGLWLALTTFLSLRGGGHAAGGLSAHPPNPPGYRKIVIRKPRTSRHPFAGSSA